MAQILFKFSFILINVVLIYASSSAFTDILEDTKQCEDTCSKSFAPHTYPNGSDNEACMRGCRLYTVTSFVTADEPEHTNQIEDDGLTPAKTLCYHSCVEAYNETSSSTKACKVGCDGQENVSLERKKEKSDLLKNEGGIHMIKPVLQIREVVSKVFGMLRIVQSSLTTYFLRDDQKIIAMEGPVEVIVQVISPEEMVDPEAQKIKLEEENKVPESLLSSGTTSIQCISKKFGLPPYLFLISVISFSIFLIYVLFIVFNSNNKKEKKAKIGLSLPTHALPVKLVRPEDLTKLSLIDEEEGQAPALPHKVKLPDNTNI